MGQGAAFLGGMLAFGLVGPSLVEAQQAKIQAQAFSVMARTVRSGHPGEPAGGGRPYPDL